MDLISVIVPVYCVEPYIEQCINSILNQSFHNLEVILVDDGSPDACPQICDDYAKKDQRLKVIHKENGGLSDTRNVGLDIASGEWIAFVDSDDFLEPTMLQTLYEASVTQKADMAVCNAAFFDSQRYLCRPDWFSVNDGCISGLDVLKTGRIPTSLVVAWNKLYRRAIFETVYYPVGRIHEDEAIAHQVLYMCDKIVCLDQKLYYYRQNPNGITKKAFNINRLDAILALADRVHYYQSHGLKDYSAPVINDFCWQLMDKFYRIEISKENQKKHRQCIKAARMIFPYYIRSKETTRAEKVVYCIFCISPRLFSWLQKKHAS